MKLLNSTKIEYVYVLSAISNRPKELNLIWFIENTSGAIDIS